MKGLIDWLVRCRAQTDVYRADAYGGRPRCRYVRWHRCPHQIQLTANDRVGLRFDWPKR